MKKYIVYTDGGSRGNPGPAAYGFVVYDQDKKELYKEGKTIGKTTNNVAEYMGIVSALTYLLAQKEQGIEIAFFMDSQLAARQLSGFYKVKSEHLRELFFTVKKLIQDLNASVTFSSVPRSQNTEADRMVNVALDGKTS